MLISKISDFSDINMDFWKLQGCCFRQ